MLLRRGDPRGQIGSQLVANGLDRGTASTNNLNNCAGTQD
jgi:hypothetical protein